MTLKRLLELWDPDLRKERAALAARLAELQAYVDDYRKTIKLQGKEVERLKNQMVNEVREGTEWANAERMKLLEQVAEATKAPPIATNTGWPHEKALHAKIERLGRALELALYYVEGDAAFEIVKEKTAKIVRGEE